MAWIMIQCLEDWNAGSMRNEPVPAFPLTPLTEFSKGANPSAELRIGEKEARSVDSADYSFELSKGEIVTQG